MLSHRMLSFLYNSGDLRNHQEEVGGGKMEEEEKNKKIEKIEK